MASRMLPDHIREKIATYPEHSYGINKISIILDNGATIRHVYVAWAKEIIRVGEKEDVTFDISRVVDVENEA